MRTGIVMQQHNAFRQLSLAYALNIRLQPDNKHLTVTSTVYCWTPLLIIFQYWALWVPKIYKHQFPCWWLAFELFPDGCLWMFPFHKLPFTRWLVMVDPHFVTSDVSVQEGVTFFTIAFVGRCPNAFVYAALWVVLGPILHKLYESQVYCGWFHRQNHG